MARHVDPRSRPRRWFERLVFGVIAIYFLRTFLVQWFYVPSGSMAPTLLGRHTSVQCPDCRWTFNVGWDDSAEEDSEIHCPSCGAYCSKLSELAPVDGDRILVDKSAFYRRTPRLWEPIAFYSPENSSRILVKRIAGRPGERVQIKKGDLFINGQLQRKPLALQRSMLINVYDGNFSPRKSEVPLPRWKAEEGNSRWRVVSGRMVHPQEKDAAADAPTDWLNYRHWTRDGNNSSRVDETPIDSSDGYNQLQRVDPPEPVDDLFLSFEFKVTGTGKLSLFSTDGREQFLIHLDFDEGHAELLQNASTVQRIEMPSPFPQFRKGSTDELLLECSLIDQQVIVAVNHVVLFTHAYIPSNVPLQAITRPLSIGTQGLGVEIWNLRIDRDIYYESYQQGLPGWGTEEPYELGENEYFVLGDNSPISDDSRFWPTGPGVPEELILGRPIVVHFPARNSPQRLWNGWEVSLPDLEQIRYIR